jgi:acetoin utilization deacetylase AcuC-like enzyme
MACTTAIVYSERYLNHDPGPTHPESPSRLRAAVDGLAKAKFAETGNCRFVKPRPALKSEVETAHSLSYIKALEKFCKLGGGPLAADTIVRNESFNTALLAVGGAVKACELVMSKNFKNAFALVRPPGHHAGLNYPYGFCLFNNVAVAAKILKESRFIRRVFIFDLDGHHGNGTQEIFNDASDILFISLHQNPRTLFPWTGYPHEIGEGEGEGFKINIPLPPGSNDEIYFQALEQLIEPVVAQFKPQFIFISAGFDAHYMDPLTDLRLSTGGYIKLFDFALNASYKFCDGRIVAVLEGGYNPASLSRTIKAAIARMAQIPLQVKDEIQPTSNNVRKEAGETISLIKEILSPYWNF